MKNCILYLQLLHGDTKSNCDLLQGNAARVGLRVLKFGNCSLGNVQARGQLLLRQPEFLTPGLDDRDIVQDVGFDDCLRDSVEREFSASSRGQRCRLCAMWFQPCQ